MAHTPGPWQAYPADYQRLHDADLLPIFVVGPEEFHTVCQVRAGSDDNDIPAQTTANARLIAAAPDLLAALKALLPGGWGDDDTMDHIPGVKQARAAIAKAIGEAA